MLWLLERMGQEHALEYTGDLADWRRAQQRRDHDAHEGQHARNLPHHLQTDGLRWPTGSLSVASGKRPDCNRLCRTNLSMGSEVAFVTTTSRLR